MVNQHYQGSKYRGPDQKRNADRHYSDIMGLSVIIFLPDKFNNGNHKKQKSAGYLKVINSDSQYFKDSFPYNYKTQADG